MTDVSASALAAGGGALQGSAQASADGEAVAGAPVETGGTATGFASELDALAEAPGGKHGRSLEVLLSKERVPIAALYNKLSDLNPGQAFHQGGLHPGTKISTEGLLENGLPGLPGSGETSEPPVGEDAGDVLTGQPDPATGLDTGLEDGPQIDPETGDVLPDDVLAGDGAGDPADAAGATEPPVEQPAEEAASDQPPVEDGEAGLAADTSFPAAPVTVAELTEPVVSVSEAGELAAAGPAVVSAEDPLPLAPLAGQATVSGAVADEPSAPVMPATERRWQSELPQELRAPELALGASLSTEEAAFQAAVVAAGASLNGENGDLPSEEAADPAGNVQSGTPAPADDEGKVTGLERALLATANASETARAALMKERGAGGKPTLAGLAPASMTDPGWDEAVAGGIQRPSASAPAGTADIKAPAPGGGSPAVPSDLAATGDDAASDAPLMEEAGSKEAGSKEGVTREAGVALNRPDGSDPQARPAPRLADRIASELPPALSAMAASGPVSGEGNQPLTLSDLALSGEIGATTVRGGELGTAMRTESLQAPNQSQSSHAATQVAAEIARNLKNGQTRFQMRFDPPELGRVEVNMKVHKDGTVQAHLVVDRPETLDMFMRDQRGLERALEAAGLNPDSDNLQFSLKQEGGGSEFASGGDGSDQGAGAGQGETDAVSAEADPVVEEIVRMRIAEQRGGLDMKI